jgi:hypothetical protein
MSKIMSEVLYQEVSGIPVITYPNGKDINNILHSQIKQKRIYFKTENSFK